MIISWFYVPKDGGEEEAVSIGSFHSPEHPDSSCIVLNLFETDDPEQAEEWRQALSRGKFPRVSDDQRSATNP